MLADWWEVAIIIRKLALSIVTKYSVDTSDGSIRQSLCNMGIMLVASMAHVYCKPFAHYDANIAEMATLFATMLVLLVGMGTVRVSDDKTGKSINDPKLVDQKLSEAESSMFYLTLYFTMGVFVVMTLVIILRRIGGVVSTM